MKKLNWKKAIGYALLLWVIMFVVVSILIAFKWYDGSGLMAWVVAAVGNRRSGFWVRGGIRSNWRGFGRNHYDAL